MSLLRYVVVENHCAESITVRLRVPKPKKGKPSRFPRSVPVPPGHKSPLLPYAMVVGTPSWDSLSLLGCVRLVTARALPRFYRLQNLSAQPIALRLAPPGPPDKRRVTRLKILPGAKSRPVNLASLPRSRVEGLVERGTIKLDPVPYLAPPTRPAPIAASFFGEDVYICYKCGRPIVFRGYPPRPIHV